MPPQKGNRSLPATTTEALSSVAGETSPLLSENGGTSTTSSRPLPTRIDLAPSEDNDGSITRRVFSEVKTQWKTAWPTLQSMVLTKIPWLISLRFVGGIGAPELAAAALATTLCNVTGLSLSVGLSSALTTLSGQAKGELCARGRKRRVSFDVAEQTSSIQNIETGEITTSVRLNIPDVNEEPLTPLLFLYRGMCIQLAFVIPIGLWWISGIEPVLIALGQQRQLAEMTAQYLKILTPGLWAYSISWTLTAWVQAIGMADVPAGAAMIGLALHLPFNWFFIHGLNMGYLGCGVATVCFQLVQAIYIGGYLFGTSKGRARLLESTGGTAIGRTRLSFWLELKIAISSIRGILNYLSLALPGIVIISEWWASEISIFLSGRLQPSPEAALGGMTLYQSINTFCFMFPMAVSIATSARVGNLLGAGNANGASFAGNVGVAGAAIVSICLGCSLYAIPHDFFPSLFAPNETNVIAEASRTIPLLAIYVFADGVQTSLNGIMKGCGRQRIAMPIVVFAYWMVGLPIAYYLAFIRNHGVMTCETSDTDDSMFCGDVGLVAGMTTGTWVHMICLAIVVGFKTDWNSEAKKAQERVSKKDDL